MKPNLHIFATDEWGHEIELTSYVHTLERVKNKAQIVREAYRDSRSTVWKGQRLLELFKELEALDEHRS